MYSLSANSQISSGMYSQALALGFNERTQIVTGYYSNQTGYDEITKESRFFCNFYFIGKLINGQCVINSFYPNQAYSVFGDFIVVNPKSFTMLLTEEHGGCPNVTHFSDKPVHFKLENLKKWKYVAYVISDKTFFYKTPTDNQHLKSYILKDDIVYIDEIIGDKGHCIFHGKTITSGWILLSDLNKFNE